MSIDDFTKKIKSLPEHRYFQDLTLSIVVFAVALGAFGLGRMSKNEHKIVIEGTVIPVQSSVLASGSLPEGLSNASGELLASSVANASQTTGGAFLASKRGKKYYPRGCSAGKNIVEGNRIYFADTAEAEKAGYTQSTSCQY